ncbi:MAG: hypothetical protein Q8P95_03980 [bacterium]|nr:hypothetical protein [bacterium]
MIFIIGSEPHWEEEQLKLAAEKRRQSVEILEPDQLHLGLSEREAQVFYRGRDITERLKKSRIIFRRTRGAQDQMYSLAVLAQHWKLSFTDSVLSILTNLNKLLHMPAFTTKLIRQIPTAFLAQGKVGLVDLAHVEPPFLVKPAHGRHGLGIRVMSTPKGVFRYLAKSKRGLLVQQYLELEEEFRLLVVGKKVLGVVKKIPPKGSRVANYAAGARFVEASIDAALKKEALSLCQQQGIDIAGVDLARAGRDWYLLEVNRCPEFKAFSKATGINVADEIISFALRKKP